MSTPNTAVAEAKPIAQGATILEAQELSKSFEVRGEDRFARKHSVTVLDDISLAVRKGESFGLVGESGCGKSTLARCLLRLLEPSGGRVLFEGEDLAALSRDELRAMRRRMQFVFQDPFASLDPRMTAGQLVEEPLLVHEIGDHAERRRAVLEMLADVGLTEEQAERRPHAFSGGQRQRIGIARALITRPRFVVCDEPVSALDVSVQAQIVNLLVDMRAELGLTYLFIAHDLAVVKHISNRVAVMYLGRIVELADAETLHAAPLHPYTRALIAAVPAMHPSLRRRGEGRRLAGDIPAASHAPTGCRFHPRCPLAIDVCRTTEPRTTEPSPGHFVACHIEG